MSRASETCGIIMKDLKLQVIWLPGEGKEGGAQKVFEEIMAENFPNSAKDKFKNFSEHQTGQTKEIHIKTHHGHTSEN